MHQQHHLTQISSWIWAHMGMLLKLLALMVAAPGAPAATITLTPHKGWGNSASWGLKRARKDNSPLTLTGVAYRECFDGTKDTNRLFVSEQYSTTSAKLLCSDHDGDGVFRVRVKGYSHAGCQTEIPMTIVQSKTEGTHLRSSKYDTGPRAEWASIEVDEPALKIFYMTPVGGSMGDVEATTKAQVMKSKMQLRFGSRTNFKMATDCSQATLDMEAAEALESQEALARASPADGECLTDLLGRQHCRRADGEDDSRKETRLTDEEHEKEDPLTDVERTEGQEGPHCPLIDGTRSEGQEGPQCRDSPGGHCPPANDEKMASSGRARNEEASERRIVSCLTGEHLTRVLGTVRRRREIILKLAAQNIVNGLRAQHDGQPEKPQAWRKFAALDRSRVDEDGTKTKKVQPVQPAQAAYAFNDAGNRMDALERVQGDSRLGDEEHPKCIALAVGLLALRLLSTRRANPRVPRNASSMSDKAFLRRRVLSKACNLT